jgi:hypothetical protein
MIGDRVARTEDPIVDLALGPARALVAAVEGAVDPFGLELVQQ